MRKRLFLLISSVLCTLGTFAYNVGDYVFTTDARYKVTGETNLIVNGDFKVSNPSDAGFGWTDDTGGVLDTEKWQISPEAGPDGATALLSKSAAAGVTIFQTVPFNAGQKLLVSFKIKVPTAVTSSTTVGDGTYIDVYANADGSASKTAEGFKQVASAVSVGTDWTDVSFAFSDESGAPGSLIITLGRLEAGSLVADFHVQEAQSVYDTRVSDRAINYAEYLANCGEFTEGVDEFKEVIAAMKEMILDPTTGDDQSAMEALIGSLATEQNNFLDKSSADFMDNIDKGGDFTKWTNYNAGGLKTYGDWTFVGGRWQHGKGADNCNDYYQFGYLKTAGSATITKEGVMGGRYMFAIDAMAQSWSKKNVRDYTYYHPYLHVFVGTDSVEYKTIDNRVYNTYTAFGNIADGETLTAGVAYPQFGETKRGGIFYIKNPVLRLLGITKDELDRKTLVASIKTQQDVLNERLGLAREDIAGTTYPWGKAALQDSVDKYQPLYEASLAYVDVNGNDVGIDIPLEYDDVLLAAVRMMGNARSAMHTLNEPFTTLVQYKDSTAQARLDDEAYKGVSAEYRTALTNEVAKASSLIASVTAETDSTSFANEYNALVQAVYNYEHSCVTPGHPASEVVINPYFADNGKGWTVTGQSDNGGWKYGDDNRFENGTKIYSGRGVSNYSKNKTLQKVTIGKKGYYEFRCQAYAVNSDQSKYNGMWNGLSGADSTRLSGVYLFFGPEDRPDSLDICTTQTTFGGTYTADEVRTFSMGYEKAADGDEIVEFGLDAMNNGAPMGIGCNLYALGGVHVYYWADKQNYVDGISEVASDVLKSNSGAVYNLMGVKVADTKADLPKGIYISGGKKFIVK